MWEAFAHHVNPEEQTRKFIRQQRMLTGSRLAVRSAKGEISKGLAFLMDANIPCERGREHHAAKWGDDYKASMPR